MKTKASFIAGFCAGLRSLTPLAVAAWRYRRPEAAAELHPASSDRLRWVVTAAAAGELVADKLPFTPSRTDRRGVAARLFLGAAAGAYLAPRGGRLPGALSGAIGSLAGTFGGHAVRVSLPKALGVADFPVAIVEDMLAIAGSLVAVAAANYDAPSEVFEE